MNYKELQQAAKEATNNQPIYGRKEFTFSAEELERFAAVIEKRTIERCASVCEGIYTNGDGAEGWLEIAAAAIRKLGEQE